MFFRSFCQKFFPSKILPKTFPKPAEHFPKTSPTSPKDLPKTSPKPVKNLGQQHAKNPGKRNTVETNDEKSYYKKLRLSFSSFLTRCFLGSLGPGTTVHCIY